MSLSKIKLSKLGFFYVFIWVMTLLFLCTGCSDNHKKEKSSANKTQGIKAIDSNFGEIKNVDYIENSIFRLKVASNGNIVYVDDKKWKIFLIDKEGFVLDSIGGKGGGPGEFALINTFRLYRQSNTIQVFDKGLQRVSYFELTPDKINLLRVTKLPNFKEYLYLQDLYTYKQQNFGVFKNYENSGNSSFRNVMVYLLNDSLEISKKLIDLKGNELIKLRNKRFMEIPLGYSVHWAFEDSLLYMSSSKTSEIITYNLDNFYSETQQFESLKRIKIDSSIVNYFLTEFDYLYDDQEMLFNLKNREFIPAYYDFKAEGSKLYFVVFNYGLQKQEILMIDLQTKEVKRISSLNIFDIQDIKRGVIYGIYRDDEIGGNTIRYIR
ncbi:6-bladed beta-propeller [bacterium]|nr:6-bladed beta-propeller [bacterium]